MKYVMWIVAKHNARKLFWLFGRELDDTASFADVLYDRNDIPEV